MYIRMLRFKEQDKEMTTWDHKLYFEIAWTYVKVLRSNTKKLKEITNCKIRDSMHA